MRRIKLHTLLDMNFVIGYTMNIDVPCRRHHILVIFLCEEPSCTHVGPFTVAKWNCWTHVLSHFTEVIVLYISITISHDLRTSSLFIPNHVDDIYSSINSHGTRSHKAQCLKSSQLSNPCIGPRTTTPTPPPPHRRYWHSLTLWY